MMIGELYHHVCVPMGLGATNLCLAAKCVAIVHSIRLETSSWAVCKQVCARIVAIATDYGTEAGLGNVPDLDMNIALPWW